MSKKETNIKKSFFKFIIYFIVKIKNDDIFALAAQLAYYLILSFFPFLNLGFLYNVKGNVEINADAISFSKVPPSSLSLILKLYVF